MPDEKTLAANRAWAEYKAEEAEADERLAPARSVYYHAINAARRKLEAKMKEIDGD